MSFVDYVAMFAKAEESLRKNMDIKYNQLVKKTAMGQLVSNRFVLYLYIV